MTNRDPYNPNPYNRNMQRSSMSMGMIAVFALLALFVVGGLMYAMSDRSTSTASSPSTTTIGQGAPAQPGPNSPNSTSRVPASK
jgi:hypothetical protein